MGKLFARLFAMVALLALASGAMAGEDVAGSGDHPRIERVEGAWIEQFERREYDRLTIPTGAYDGEDYAATQSLEGERLEFVYRFVDPQITTLRIKRSYERALDAAGFEILYAASEDELGARQGRRFLTGSSVFGRPGRMCCPAPTSGDIGMRYLAARSAEGDVLLSMLTYRDRFGDGPVVLLDVVTAEKMTDDMAHRPLSADEMGEGLIEQGRVAVQNIQFEFDSDAILPESAQALASIAELLAGRTDLRLLVVGHTDNVGDFDYNLRLSMERAAAVVGYLVDEHGVERERLRPAGAGMMSPVTTNRTEQGRALNRRVELVELGD